LQVLRERVETAYRAFVEVDRDGDIDLARADAGAGGMGVEHGLHSLDFGFA
jgi:hypothetical protein